MGYQITARITLFVGLANWTLVAGAAMAAECAPPPPAVIDIDANGYYSDSNHSVIDPVQKARNVANTRPIEDYLARIADDASRYRFDPATGAADARCALAWLAAWADQGAMLGKLSTRQSYYVRKWTLAGLALSYAKLRAAASASQQAAIDKWLRALADATIEHSDAYKGARNNHYYWEGLAVSAVGALTGDQRYLAWGRKVFEAAMAQVAANGSLPLEMARAIKALDYHAFAVTPLVMIASILDLHSPKLDGLVRFTIAQTKNPARIEQLTGFTQQIPGDAGMSWEVIYARHEADPGFAPRTPGRQPRLGGDLLLANPLEHLAAR